MLSSFLTDCPTRLTDGLSQLAFRGARLTTRHVVWTHTTRRGIFRLRVSSFGSYAFISFTRISQLASVISFLRC